MTDDLVEPVAWRIEGVNITDDPQRAEGWRHLFKNQPVAPIEPLYPESAILKLQGEVAEARRYHRWTTSRRSDGTLEVCRGEHEGDNCEWESFVPVDRLEAAEAEVARMRSDTARLDWLETMVVNVRDKLVHGSRDLFWATPDDSAEGETGPSDLRKQIDAALQSLKPGERS